MSEAQITVKNTGSSDLTVRSIDGRETVIGAGSIKALERSFLLGQSFQVALKKGELTFTKGPASTEERELGIVVFRALLGTVGSELVATARNMTESKRRLGDRRDTYNGAWTHVKQTLEAGHKLGSAAKNLADGAKMFLTSEGAQSQLAEANKLLDEYDQKFIAAGTPSAATLKSYLEARRPLQAAVDAAQAALKASQTSLAAEFSAVQQALDDAGDTLSTLLPESIGTQLQWQ